MSNVIARYVRITGRVQGVWYRAWTAQEAKALNLDGFVRNRVDGSVEAVFKGPETQVRTMIEKCHEGPPLAQVTDIKEKEFDEAVEPGFQTLPTL